MKRNKESGIANCKLRIANQLIVGRSEQFSVCKLQFAICNGSHHSYFSHCCLRFPHPLRLCFKRRNPRAKWPLLIAQPWSRSISRPRSRGILRLPQQAASTVGTASSKTTAHRRSQPRLGQSRVSRLGSRRSHNPSLDCPTHSITKSYVPT